MKKSNEARIILVLPANINALHPLLQALEGIDVELYTEISPSQGQQCDASENPVRDALKTGALSLERKTDDSDCPHAQMNPQMKGLGVHLTVMQTFHPDIKPKKPHSGFDNGAQIRSARGRR